MVLIWALCATLEALSAELEALLVGDQSSRIHDSHCLLCARVQSNFRFNRAQFRSKEKYNKVFIRGSGRSIPVSDCIILLLLLTAQLKR